MFKFEYEISTNEEGRPFVEQSKDNLNEPEHKFMAIELTRYMLHQLLIDNQNEKGLTDEHLQEIAEVGMTLEKISNQIAGILLESKNALDELGLDVKDDD